LAGAIELVWGIVQVEMADCGFVSADDAGCLTIARVATTRRETFPLAAAPTDPGSERLVKSGFFV
jgi:hypothetical protein